MTKLELLVSIINIFAERNDLAGFLRLSENPEERDVDVALGRALFARAPFADPDAILAVPRVGKKTRKAVAKAVLDNLSGAEITPNADLTFADINSALELMGGRDPNMGEVIGDDFGDRRGDAGSIPTGEAKLSLKERISRARV